MPRKNEYDRLDRAGQIQASMRPRPDAAEKPLPESKAWATLNPASMRPRPDAAEKRR